MTVGKFIDHSERNRAETALQEREQQLRTVLQTTHEAFYLIDTTGKLLEVNNAYCTMSGYAREELLQMRVADLELLESEQEVVDHIRRVVQQGCDRFETQHRRKDGRVLDVECSVTFQDTEGGHFVCFLRDITERKRTEQSLRESEERFRKLLEMAPLPLAFVTEDGAITFRNQRFVSVFGYTAEDVPTVSEWWQRAYPDPEYRQWAIDTWETVVRVSIAEGRDIKPTEANITCKNGEVRIVEVSGITMGDKVLATFIDVTERKRTEQSLRESEQRFRNVVESAPVGMFIDTDGLFRYLNPAALALFGAEQAEQIVGQTVLERIHPDSRTAASERARQVAEERKPVPFLEERYLRLDGTELDVEVTAIPFSFQERNGAIVFARDISERKREEDKRKVLEQQLLHALKMKAVGRLAGGVAHDFNNLLTVIQGYTEMLQDALPTHAPLRRNTQEILKAADRAASLTRQLLAFGRKQILCPVVLDLNSLIDETSKMLERIIGEDIEVQVRPADPLWAIEADSDQIVQVLMNLCVNARDAMPQGGTLTIATENVTINEAHTGEAPPFVVPGQYVSVSVADTGIGISKEVQEQIFEPFFTTKTSPTGTGLGLATVYGIVKQSGGNVWVDSELGQGARFTVYLPRVRGAISTESSPEAGACLGGTETILVAEDEESLRNAVCEFLQSLGYKILAAGSGQQALSLAAQVEEPIDLLITDLVMPKISGRELSQVLGSLRLGLKTIYMSGHTEDAVLRHGIHELGNAFLQKPFSLRRLARQVRDTLDVAENLQ
jgi:PAS domain S-box-containing protein